MRISERKRLKTVRRYQQLNLNDNQALNDLIALTMETCNVPMAMITIMGADVQWIKSKSGNIDIDKHSRDDSFCKYLINKKGVMVVPDALDDKRFLKNPLVSAEDGIRFYAGAPLITSTGYHIGSLCVFDKKRRFFLNNKKEMLAILARQVMAIMELQMGVLLAEQHNIELMIQKGKTVDSERKLRAFFNSSLSCHTLIGKGLEILDFNHATAALIKKQYNKKIEAGRNISYYINSSYKEEFMKHIKNAFAGNRTNKEILINDGKESVWWNISFEPVNDQKGTIISVASTATNINEQKQQIIEITRQNELLLNIAYIQSHEYRKPVASILGLMNVIKEYNYKASKECLIMMETAVKDLDEKIRHVVNYIQDNMLPKIALEKLLNDIPLNNRILK